jgi:hypothetical protein
VAAETIILDDETRERLHAVLYYLVESEAKSFWHRWHPAEREGHVYAKVLCLLRFFGFEDLLQEDAGWRDIGHPEEEP